MSKKGRQQNKQQKAQRRSSPLSSHQRRGKMLTPPLMNIPNVSFVSWERDNLPDYLLMAAFLHDRPAEGTHWVHGLLKVIDLVLEEAGESAAAERTRQAATDAATETEPEAGEASEVTDAGNEDDRPEPASVFSGRLTEFEAFSEAERAAILQRLVALDIFEDLVPEPVFHMLGMYPDAPGSWLLQPWRDRGAAVDPQVAEQTLGRILTEAGPQQGTLATRTKILVCNRWGDAGRMHVPAHMAEEFNGWPYPDEKGDENKMVEASYRAMFGSLGNLFHRDPDPVKAWAEKFWRVNWQIYACRWPDAPLLLDPDDVVETTTADAEEFGGPEPFAQNGEVDEAGEGAARVTYWRQTLDDARDAMESLQDEFQTLAEKTDPDLYNPDRYEVLTGIVGRTLRYLSVFVGYPPLWTMEHGAPVLRALVEARIMLRFLIRRNDPDLYAKFKAYGMGKLKLLKLHLENVIDEQDEPPPDLVEYVEYLDALVNQDVMEEFQQIDVGGSFAGIDTRRMAAEADLEREYRLLFAPASSNVHGEWSIIDEYVFVRCGNPAHRRHRVLCRDRDHRTGPMFLDSLFNHAGLLIDDYREATENQRKLS